MFAQIKRDVRVVFDRDPAARSIWEVLLCYPGLHAIWLHRIAHRLYKAGWVLLPRLICYFSRILTGVDIHPGATIGEGLFIDHATGVVIGETAIVGNNVTLYQGVTLGGTGKEKGKRHPTVGNNVVVASGAKVLGSFKVGDNSKIGAGSVVLQEVPPNSTVVGIPGKIVWHEGRKVSSSGTTVPCDDIDLQHDVLPDPVTEMMMCMQRNLIRMEARVEYLEKELKKHDLKSL
ncbi:MAG TPA: serine O-acetyltransferase [Patescibacteria group bacterium]|nr:serine O-acetyltransferase [Patescibacteria group bacterium]